MQPSFTQKIQNILPGLFLCGFITVLAKIFADFYTMPVMLMALFLGLILHFTIKKEKIKDGIDFTSRHILKMGVILLGARIAFSDLSDLGLPTIALTIVAIAAVIVISISCAKFIRAEKSLGILIGGATAICGASAAIALSTVLPKSKNLEHNTLFAVIGATAIGTIAMMIYPIIMGSTNLTPDEAGILVGGTIHDVSQVVGAGYSISPETGDTAILVKLTRVFMLGPIILLFALINRREQQTSEKPEFPLFLIGFVILVALNSFNLLPPDLVTFLSQTSKWLLVMGITAIGIKTSLEKLFSLGWKPLVLILVDTAVISIIYYFAIHLNWL